MTTESGEAPREQQPELFPEGRMVAVHGVLRSSPREPTVGLALSYELDGRTFQVRRRRSPSIGWCLPGDQPLGEVLRYLNAREAGPDPCVAQLGSAGRLMGRVVLAECMVLRRWEMTRDSVGLPPWGAAWQTRRRGNRVREWPQWVQDIVEEELVSAGLSGDDAQIGKLPVADPENIQMVVPERGDLPGAMLHEIWDGGAGGTTRVVTLPEQARLEGAVAMVAAGEAGEPVPPSAAERLSRAVRAGLPPEVAMPGTTINVTLRETPGGVPQVVTEGAVDDQLERARRWANRMMGRTEVGTETAGGPPFPEDEPTRPVTGGTTGGPT